MKIGTTTLATYIQEGRQHLVLLELQEYDEHGVGRFYPVYSVAAPSNWSVRKKEEPQTGESPQT